MVLAHGGTLGLALESLAVASFMLIVWLVSKGRNRGARAVAAGRKPRRQPVAQAQARAARPAQATSKRSPNAKRRR